MMKKNTIRSFERYKEKVRSNYTSDDKLDYLIDLVLELKAEIKKIQK